MPVSYKNILKISTPIMIGSAVQNVIALTDQFFLGRADNPVWTGAIGYVGVFYLIITSIGYGFSKGGQIMIARLMGEQREYEIGKVTYGMIAFQLTLATFFFILVKLFAPYFFHFMVNSEAVYKACLEFLDYRIYGVFFSYIGVSVLALYSGVARTTAIIYNAIVLGVVNILANYCLVFGNWGFPAMGMAGSGLASSLSEAMATVFFVLWMISDYKHLRIYGFMGAVAAGREEVLRTETETWWEWFSKEIHLVIAQFKISLPIVIQAAVGLGSWFVFFTVVENIGGERALDASSVMRAVYLIFMIPVWGLSSGINTIASNLIGQGKQDSVLAVIRKTAILGFVITMIACVFLLLFPNQILTVGTDKPQVIADAAELVWVLVIALGLYSVSAIYFNGLVGTGATAYALRLQIICVLVYMAYVYGIAYQIGGNLVVVWMSEFIYWTLLFILVYIYLRSGKWKSIKLDESNKIASTGLDHF